MEVLGGPGSLGYHGFTLTKAVPAEEGSKTVPAEEESKAVPLEEDSKGGKA